MAATPKDLRTWWARLAPLPGGKALFSRAFGFGVPYSGTVAPRILTLEPGRAVIAIRDRRSVRNHLDSVHAIALTNLAELTTGLALGFGLPDGMRTILVKVECAFLKKARGTITAACEAPVFTDVAETELQLESVLTDEAGDIVARGKAVWRAGPVKR